MTASDLDDAASAFLQMSPSAGLIVLREGLQRLGPVKSRYSALVSVFRTQLKPSCDRV